MCVATVFYPNRLSTLFQRSLCKSVIRFISWGVMVVQVNTGESSYQVYVLRLWREQMDADDQPAVWRFSLDDTATGKRYGFGNIEALVAYLSAQIGSASQQMKTELPPAVIQNNR
jgi:hypothetical protein